MTGNSLFDKILIAINGLVAIAAAGMVIYGHMGIKPEPTDQAAEEAKLKESAQTATQQSTVDFKKEIINIHSVGSRLRYLETEMSVLPFNDADKEIIKNGEFIFRDALIEIGASMTPDDLNSVTGKILLESRLKNRVNQVMGRPVVRQIYFRRFLVQ